MSEHDAEPTGTEVEYWYNDRTGEVEKGPQSLGTERIGPFSTAEEAARAPQIVAERAARWREEDAEEA